MVFDYVKCAYCGYENEIFSVFEKVKCKYCFHTVKTSPTKPLHILGGALDEFFYESVPWTPISWGCPSPKKMIKMILR